MTLPMAFGIAHRLRARLRPVLSAPLGHGEIHVRRQRPVRSPTTPCRKSSRWNDNKADTRGSLGRPAFGEPDGRIRPRHGRAARAGRARQSSSTPTSALMRRKADVWLPVRPGTDTGLLLCWFRYIFENKLYNEEFTKYWTNLPFLIDPDTKLPVKAEGAIPEDFKSRPTPENTPAYVCVRRCIGRTRSPSSSRSPEDADVDPEIFCDGATIDGKTVQDRRPDLQGRGRTVDASSTPPRTAGFRPNKIEDGHQVVHGRKRCGHCQRRCVGHDRIGESGSARMHGSRLPSWAMSTFLAAR